MSRVRIVAQPLVALIMALVLMSYMQPYSLTEFSYMSTGVALWVLSEMLVEGLDALFGVRNG